MSDDINPTPIYDECAWDHGFAPMPHDTDELVERIARALAFATESKPFDELPASIRDQFRADAKIALTVVRDPDRFASTLYTGHGLGHTYRTDVAL